MLARVQLVQRKLPQKQNLGTLNPILKQKFPIYMYMNIMGSCINPMLAALHGFMCTIDLV